jgi:hypothetical protein
MNSAVIFWWLGYLEEVTWHGNSRVRFSIDDFQLHRLAADSLGSPCRKVLTFSVRLGSSAVRSAGLCVP